MLSLVQAENPVLQTLRVGSYGRRYAFWSMGAGRVNSPLRVVKTGDTVGWCGMALNELNGLDLHHMPEGMKRGTWHTGSPFHDGTAWPAFGRFRQMKFVWQYTTCRPPYFFNCLFPLFDFHFCPLNLSIFVVIFILYLHHIYWRMPLVLPYSRCFPLTSSFHLFLSSMQTRVSFAGVTIWEWRYRMKRIMKNLDNDGIWTEQIDYDTVGSTFPECYNSVLSLGSGL